VEEFITGKHQDVDYIQGFYRDDFDDYSNLKLNRDTLVGYAKSKKIDLEDFECVLSLLCSSEKHISPIIEFIPDLVKLIKIVLCMPMTSCTCERSFSGLRRLKTYLRATMSQERLNHIAVLNIHSDVANSLDLDPLINEFIKRASVRMNTFAIL